MCYRSLTDLHIDNSIPVLPLDGKGFERWCEHASEAQIAWVKSNGFMAGPGQLCAVPGENGGIESWLVGMQKEGRLYQLADLPGKLPEGLYRLECDWPPSEQAQAALGWGLGSYRFDRYVEGDDRPRPELLIDEEITPGVQALCAAQNQVRTLVNTPTEHMGPAQLADAVQAAADEFDADFASITGDELLTQNFPAIHAVGRASHRPPRLLQLTWGDESSPLLVLVGKGVCFDTGGLDLKSAAGMALMKKDMGGAAHVLALARLVMQHRLPVRLMLLIPAVENAVAGNAYRPGDVLSTRKGISVEVGNTDAEGRVVLSDALALACEHDPDLVIDFATLTGAARIALGADLPPLFSNDDTVSAGIQQAGDEVEDPLWTMPLYQPYKALIKSPVADITNSGKSSFGGCITAALFLEHFVSDNTPWVHIDTFAWNQSNRSGRPEGGEALGLRAVFEYLKNRY